MTPTIRAARSGGRGVGGGAVLRAARPAGLGAGLRIAQSVYIPLPDEVLPAGASRLQVAMLNPATDRHVTHPELGGSLLDREQLFLFHAADATASCEQDNTLGGYTGYLKTCIIHSQDIRSKESAS